MSKTKDEYPRSFYFKLYRVFCKMLDVTCICYGKMNKNDKFECIYGIDKIGVKYRLICRGCHLRYSCMNIRLLGQSFSHDIQKAIVKRIMKELERSDVFINNMSTYYTKGRLVIPQGLDFEKCVIEHDLSI